MHLWRVDGSSFKIRLERHATVLLNCGRSKTFFLRLICVRFCTTPVHYPPEFIFIATVDKRVKLECFPKTGGELKQSLVACEEALAEVSACCRKLQDRSCSRVLCRRSTATHAPTGLPHRLLTLLSLLCAFVRQWPVSVCATEPEFVRRRVAVPEASTAPQSTFFPHVRVGLIHNL